MRTDLCVTEKEYTEIRDLVPISRSRPHPMHVHARAAFAASRASTSVRVRYLVWLKKSSSLACKASILKYNGCGVRVVALFRDPGAIIN